MWEWIIFPDTLVKNSVGRKNQINASEILSSGKYPVIDQGQDFIAGYCDDETKLVNEELPQIIFGDHTRCFKYVDFPFIIGADGTKALKPNTALFDPKYYYFALLSLNIHSRGYNRHFTLLKEKKVPKPDLFEQRRIAHLLSIVQITIEQQVRLIKLTRKLKAALMHKLFTEGLRGEKQKNTEIGLMPESWEIRSLESMTIAIDYGTSVKCDYVQKGFPVLRIPNVVGGSVDISDLKYGQPKKNEIDKLKLSKGDLLFVRTNGVHENAGRCSIFKDEIKECYFASYLIRVQLDNLQLIPEYLNEYVRTEVGKSFLSGRAIRTADGKFNINSGTIRKVLIPVPKIIDEQEEIAKQLDLLEQKTKLHLQKQSLLQELFRALLYQLMTGQTRVNDIELPGFS